MSDARTDAKGSLALPHATSKLIEELDRGFPLRTATPNDLSSERDRIQYAFYAGKRELVDMLKQKLERHGVK